MTERERESLALFALEAASDWGREAALIDNEKLGGTWRETSYRHRQAIMLEMQSLHDTEAGREARRLFANAYDTMIDFSIQPGGRHRT